jgi:hypothetical protein
MRPYNADRRMRSKVAGITGESTRGLSGDQLEAVRRALVLRLAKQLTRLMGDDELKKFSAALKAATAAPTPEPTPNVDEGDDYKLVIPGDGSPPSLEEDPPKPIGASVDDDQDQDDHHEGLADEDAEREGFLPNAGASSWRPTSGKPLPSD